MATGTAQAPTVTLPELLALTDCAAGNVVASIVPLLELLTLADCAAAAVASAVLLWELLGLAALNMEATAACFE